MSDQVNEEIEKLQNPSLAPRLSKQHLAWQKALHGGDAALLEYLAFNDDPTAALLEIETYINGIYRGSLHRCRLPRQKSSRRRLVYWPT